MSHVDWNEYVDAFMFNSEQFWVSRERKKWDVQRLYEAMQMVSSTRGTLQVMSALLWMFREKIWPGPKSPKISQKQPKLKVIIHAFGLSRGPSSESHGIPHRDMGGHWKWVMWIGTNMWMPLCSFRDNFGFHEKWKKWDVQRLYEAMQMVLSTRGTSLQLTSHVGTPMNVSGENMTSLGEVQKCPKNSKN